MIVPLALLVGALCLALAGWASWFVVVDRAVILRQLWGGAVIEAVLRRPGGRRGRRRGDR